MLLDVFSPLSIWYGFCQVTVQFIMYFSLGFRATCSYKYPKLTRRCFSLQIWLYPLTITINLVGPSYLLMMGYICGKMDIYSCVFLMIAIFGWLYDDYLLMKAFCRFSKQKYEDADILDAIAWADYEQVNCFLDKI